MRTFSILWQSLCVTSVVALVAASPAAAQTAEAETQTTTETPAGDEPIDEVISFGTQILGQHEGMDAFFRGDFETAEIEFESEYKSLRRFRSAQENASYDAELSYDRALDSGAAGSNEGASVNGPGGGGGFNPSEGLASASSVSSNFSTRRTEGQTVLTDGKVTYEDYAFSSYMAGLSEIKQGKYGEARDSLKASLRHDDKNFDARMRLGLIYVKQGEFEKAADELERLDKQRRKCIKLSCDDRDALRDSTLILAQQITKATQSN